MSKEYIEREALHKEIRKLQDKLETDNDKAWDINKPYYKGLAMARGILNEQPSADVAPIVHGEWIGHGNWWGHIEYKCSACTGQTFDASEFAYCPHCGAKMDGGK